MLVLFSAAQELKLPIAEKGNYICSMATLRKSRLADR